jgi:DNA repair photolyase
MTEQLFELRRTTFDTPHFKGIEFIEVEAKSILNNVPGNYLPFNWTINPYRGCTHSCTYCLSGETPILMADGRTKPLSDVRVGDWIYGTKVGASYRTYTITQVLAHWQTIKRAYRVTLEDGTKLICSGDHRFLTNRGWKHVTGAGRGKECRPHLTTNNKLMGVGAFAKPLKKNEDYRRGYLCGMVRGDANLDSYTYEPRPGRLKPEVMHRFRLALADPEALERARSYLDFFDVRTTEFHFSAATAARREIRAIRASSREAIERITHLIEWPGSPTQEWFAGFLAGIFDAEGSFSCLIFRIANTDSEIIKWTSRALMAFGFDISLDRRSSPNVMTSVRILGGLSEKLRFFHTVDPAITRERLIDGVAIKNKGRLKVVSVQSLGFETPMYDITTGTGDFIADGVVSHNCFARSTHTYMDMNAGRDFETKIVVKVNAPQLLRKELRAKRWKGEHIAMGTATDPYQRAEGRYKIMPEIIKTLTEYRNPFSILTKGTLILRDLELLVAAANVTEVSTAFSIGTLDEDAWRSSEPGTPHPRKRMEAVKKLNDAGIPCGVMVAPVLPGISDRPDQLEEVVTAAVEAGATHITPILLHLRPKVKEVYMEWLQETYPHLVSDYEAMYGRRSYASEGQKKALAGRVQDLLEGAPRPRPTPMMNALRAKRQREKEKAAVRGDQLSFL